MKQRFCAYCGGSVALTRIVDDPLKRLVCRKCGTVFHTNPKPAVGAIIISDGKLLLVKRQNMPFKNYWTIPGGFMEVNEHPIDTLHREFREELSIQICVDKKPFYVTHDRYGKGGDHLLCLFYLAWIIQPDQPFQPGSDIRDAQWFPLNALPSRIAFKNNIEVLEEVKKAFCSASVEKRNLCMNLKI